MHDDDGPLPDMFSSFVYLRWPVFIKLCCVLELTVAPKNSIPTSYLIPRFKPKTGQIREHLKLFHQFCSWRSRGRHEGPGSAGGWRRPACCKPVSRRQPAGARECRGNGRVGIARPSESGGACCMYGRGKRAAGVRACAW